jgi:hypothetical protein
LATAKKEFCVVDRTVLRCAALALIFLQASAFAADAPTSTARTPTIRLNPATGKEAMATLDVVGLDAADLARLANVKWETAQWAALFAVHVAERGAKEAQNPPVLGSYQVGQGVLRFTPRFPLAPGVRFRAVFDGSQIPGRVDKSKPPVVAEFQVPKPNAAPTTVVRQIYPTRNLLPENELKLYLHFSSAMSRGDAYRHVRLLDASGKPVPFPFLEVDQELWDPEGKRLTLLFEPGRIKRGLKPREEAGPILEEGKTYTLVIDRAWPDANGNPLKETFRKAFKVGAPDDQPPDPKTWKLTAPSGGKTEPLTVVFPKPMDQALLERLLWVTDADGRAVPGTATISEEETRWQFTPELAWHPGPYHLVADTRLEDLAGNSIGRPFEVDVFRPVQREIKTETVQLPFRVGR